MKKFIFLIMAFAIASTLKGQTPILSEGFEGSQFPPQGWARESIYMSFNKGSLVPDSGNLQILSILASVLLIKSDAVGSPKVRAQYSNCSIQCC